MRGRRPTTLAALAGLALVVLGTALPSAAAYVIGVLLCAGAAGLALGVRTRRWAAVLVPVTAAALALGGPALARPGTEGLSGDWSAAAIDGQVLGGRALVGDDNSSVDLVTGKTVRLGSVPGGDRFVGDDRMIVVTRGRVDSVRLDATERWTWRSTSPGSLTPLAADEGMTVLRLCGVQRGATCRLVGLDARGRRAWTTDAPGQSADTRPLNGPAASLPRVAALAAPGADAGLFLVDPPTGQRTLVPGQSALPVPDGSLAVVHVSGGRCVTSLYAAPRAVWTRVTDGACSSARPQDWFAAGGVLWVQREGRWTRVSLEDGRPDAAAEVPIDAARRGLVLDGRRASVQARIPLGVNPFRGSRPASSLRLTEASGGTTVARLVARHDIALLRLERDAVVVREGDRVVRYALDPT